MELIQVANFLNGRYLISNMKADKKALLLGDLLASYSVDSLGKSKTYILNLKKMQRDHLAAMRTEWETQHHRYAEVCSQINELKMQREELKAKRKRIQ